MTPPFPNSPAPNWFRRIDWEAAYSKRNGVHYVGVDEEVIIDLTWPQSSYNTFARTANFDTGTSGTPITTSERPDYSPITAVLGTPSYSSTHAYGLFSGKFGNGTNQTVTIGSTAIDERYFRVYLYATVNPSTGNTVVCRGNSFTLTITTAGKPRLSDQGAVGTIMSNSISLNQWVRIEWKIVGSTDTAEIKLFNTASSTIPTETLAIPVFSTGAIDNNFIMGPTNTAWGADYWLDNVVAGASSYPGPFDPNQSPTTSIDWIVYDFYGNTVAAGVFDEYKTWFTIPAPAGGWDPGWYRVYLTGPQNAGDYFFTSYGASNFCFIRPDANFNTMPAGNVSAGADVANDYVMKGVLGMGTSRLNITNANAPTTGANTLAEAVSDAAITADYWTDNGLPDSERPERTAWVAFPNQTWDWLEAQTVVATDYGVFMCADGSLDGGQVFVDISNGTDANTDKVRIFYPDAVTLVETFDNLDNSAEAMTNINAASTKVKFFSRVTNQRAALIGPTAIGNDYRDGVALVASTLYPLGVTRFEGPSNEPDMTAETAHKMRLFQGAVHAGNANAKAIGPCTIAIPPATSWAGFLDADGGDYCDEISFHAYNAVTNGDLNLGRATIETFLGVLDSYGLGSVPLWQTESVHGFTPVYRIYHPRRARKPLLETLLFEQKGVPRERNNQWYDVSNGFWDFPSWIENADGSVEPQAVMSRVLAEETFGKVFASAVDFGDPGNAMVLGSVYEGVLDQVLVLMTPCWMDDFSVTLTLAGMSVNYVTVVDGFGVETVEGTSENKQITVTLDDRPKYIRLEGGVTVTVDAVNLWSPTNSSVSPAASVKELDGASLPVIADDAYMTNYSAGTGIVPATWSTPPSEVELNWVAPQTINRVCVWCGPSWQNSGTMVAFDVLTTSDGVDWTVRASVSKDPLTGTYFEFGTDASNSGCFLETFWDEQWIFDIGFSTPVQATGVRIDVSEASYGGEPLSTTTYGTAFGQGNANQALRLQEVGVFESTEITPEPPIPPPVPTPRRGGSGPVPKDLQKRKAGDGEVGRQSYIILSG